MACWSTVWKVIVVVNVVSDFVWDLNLRVVSFKFDIELFLRERRSLNLRLGSSFFTLDV